MITYKYKNNNNKKYKTMEKLENEIFEGNPRFDNYLKILECIYGFEVNNLQNREKSEHESVIGFYNAIKNKDLRVVYNSSIIHNEEYGEICAIQTTLCLFRNKKCSRYKTLFKNQRIIN